ncbi:hypothetical protein Fcan01_18168 [Folsomia candida]|uniref:Uncharacterized protein n=1 Tax=Folsomia candida TaxID=158441 RepID=A0A226DQV0_FOLCA|nr:hypothetical protein Fcan01_18168 [Folsomia candida]
MFSKFAFGAISRFFYTLQKLDYTPPNIWNLEKQKFEMDPKPNKIRWTLSNLNVVLAWIFLPIYILSTRIDILNSTQVIFLVLELFLGIHAVPLFFKAYTNGEELSLGMNTYFQVEKWLRENLIVPVTGSDPIWHRDLVGLIFNGMATSLLSFIFTAPILLVIVEIDPVSLILPYTPPSSSYAVLQLAHFLLRLLLATLALAEIVSTIGLAHLTLIMLTLYSKTCIKHFKLYHGPVTRRSSQQILPQISQKNLMEKEQSSNQLHDLSDFDLYVVLMVQCHLVRQYIDTVAVFIIAPGFAIMVITLLANYVVIMLLGKILLPLYLIIALLAVLAPALGMGELTEAGKSNGYSTKLLKYWRGSSPEKRTRWGRRKIRSLHPIEFSVGPFFLVTQRTFAIYMNVILNYTVNAILVL